MQHRISKLLMIVMVLTMVAAALPLLPSLTSHAQGANLLLNPSFDQAFVGSADGFVPTGWAFWHTGDPVETDRDTFGAYVRSAPHSWKMYQRYNAAVTGAAGYQRATVEAGKTYTATVYSYVYACNDTVHSCRIGDEIISDPTAGAKVRIGLDPAGGTDPNAATVVWSAFASPSEQVVWQQLSVTAQSTGTSMTVFLYFSSTTGLFYTEAHWDDAALVSADGSVPGAPAGATPVPPTPAFVPFVVAQQPRADGSVVHVVQASDTIDSIMVAYNDLYAAMGYTKEDLYEFNNWRFPPEFIIIGQEIVILPAGFVDPATGELLVEPNQPVPTQAEATTEPTAAPTEAAATAEPGVEATAVPTESAAGSTPAAPATEEAAPATETAPVEPAGPPVSEAVQSIDPFLPEGSIAP